MTNVGEASELLTPYDARLMRCYPVSTRINHVASDDVDALDPWRLPRFRIDSSPSRTMATRRIFVARFTECPEYDIERGWSAWMDYEGEIKEELMDSYRSEHPEGTCVNSGWGITRCTNAG